MSLWSKIFYNLRYHHLLAQEYNNCKILCSINVIILKKNGNQCKIEKILMNVNCIHLSSYQSKVPCKKGLQSNKNKNFLDKPWIYNL